MAKRKGKRTKPEDPFLDDLEEDLSGDDDSGLERILSSSQATSRKGSTWRSIELARDEIRLRRELKDYLDD